MAITATNIRPAELNNKFVGSIAGRRHSRTEDEGHLQPDTGIL